MVIHVICRCLICAVKYGYLSRHFHALIMHTKLSQTLLAQMYVLAAQANYNVFNMNIEVSAVKHRQKVEEETFYFRVPQGGVKERLRGPAFYQSEQAFDIKLIDKEIKDFKDNEDPVIKDFIIDKIISKPLSDQYKLSCESLISEIQYIVRKSNPYSFAFVSLVALVHGFIPVFCRLYQGIRPFGCNSYDYAFFTLCFIQTFLLYTINYMFLVLSHTVYKQQCDIMEIMSSFLTTHNQSANKFNGLFPMINIYCPSTIFSWLKLRGCLLDFGRRYTIRIQMYILILIPFGTALYALLCIKSIANIDLSIPITLEVQSYVIFDTLLLFVNIVKILRIGTHVNSYNIKHKELLLELKQDVLQYRLKQKEKEILTKSIEWNTSNEQNNQRLLALVDTIDQVIEKLDFIHERQPVRFLGFMMTNELLQSFVTLFFTLSVAYIQSKPFA
ncbi:hypothetical protein FGO68_gene1403 [Halteria grandinella]|uniref:Uncharacterized protein n=1 Tax=Halteria grandinella TaxID=5974 RepID=A0A8J8NTX6_HALGN|nr:hypothetical protein FGO68_gene1403 [Halteria grandinella]